MSAKGRTSWGKRLAGEDPVTGLTPSGLSNRALHALVKLERGPASGYPCSHADKTCSDGRVDWACISRLYLDVDDFMPLCRSHHLRFDMTPERAARAAATHLGGVQTPEHRANISAAVKASMTPEVRAKMSAAARSRTPEQVSRVLAAAAAGRAKNPGGLARGGLAASHARWHVGRGIVSPDCGLCQTT